MHTFFHSGDLGDIIACLPTIRELSGGELVIGFRPGKGFCRESMQGARFDAIKPLLELQEYITGVRWGEPEKGMLDFSTFRFDPARPGENLATRQARHIGTLISLEPWLEVDASDKAKGKAVFARSRRYHNTDFNWIRQIEENPDHVFVGTSAEHEFFQIDVSRTVKHLPTANLLELAQVIKGCAMFVGNQSCPFWIAAALGVYLVQETSPKAPDSIIPRLNAFYPLAPVWNPEPAAA